jgi:hypothetical protein
MGVFVNRILTGGAPAALALIGILSCSDSTAPDGFNADDLSADPNRVLASIEVHLASDTIEVGRTTEATVVEYDRRGRQLYRPVNWTSSDTTIATVTDSGVVTGVARGNVIITAKHRTVIGSAALVVILAGTDTTTIDSTPPPPAPSGTVADPTQLPIANRQTPPSGSYGRSLTSGQFYTDPVSGMRVLKVTDATTPIANTRAHHDYSEGGPYISQPWQGTDGQTYYTLMVAVEPNRYLVEVRYSDLTLSNWRIIDIDGDLSFAFSLNPATPRIAYVELNSLPNVVQRYNTSTNRVENTGNWPWRPAAGFISWLQTQLNDTWLVTSGNNTTVVAFRPSDALQRSWAPANLDEPHLDREKPYAYLAVGNQIYECNLVTGAAAVLAPGDPAWSYHPNSLENSDHSAPLRGHLVGVANSANLKYYSYDVAANVTRSYTGVFNVAGFPGEEHRAGQWVFNNGDGNTDQWWAIDPSGSDNSNAAIRSGMIGLSNINGTSSARILAVHNSTGGSNYQVQPHVTFAPDGKFVMWTSDSHGTRTDVYVVRMPVR